MLKFSADLAQGDFREHPHNIDSHDEIGALAGALVDMRAKLRDFIRHVHSSVEMVAASSEELTATGDQTAKVSTQISQSVCGMARGADEQLSAIEKQHVF